MVKCKECKKETKKYDRDGSIFCNQKCYFKWKRKNPNKRAYKGRVFISGYWYLYMPSHPNAIKKGRYIAEQNIGRYLTKNEIAHHINEDKTDNRPKNIKMMTISEHNKLTYKNRKKNKYGKLK